MTNFYHGKLYITDDRQTLSNMFQAPEPQKQKRKRARQIDASAPDEDASGREAQRAHRSAVKSRRADQEEQDDAEATRPRKRGRPSKSHDIAQPADTPPEKALRNRISRASMVSQEDEVDRENEEAEQPTKATRKRGRPLKESASTGNKMRTGAPLRNGEEEEQVEEEEPGSGPRRSNRERRSWNAEEIFSAKIPSKESAVETAPEPTKPKRRPRTSKEGPIEESTHDHAQAEAPRPRKKRARPSTDGDDASAKGHVKRRGRPSASEAQEATQDEPSQPRRRGRPRTSNASQHEAEPSESQEPAQRRPRRSSGEGVAPPKPRARKARPSNPEPAGEEEPAAYRHLKSQARQVSRKTIDTQWAPLNAPAINAITTLLADAQRPVLLRLQDKRGRREQASAAISTVTRRLRSKLIKGMPFPPPTTTTTTANRTAVEDDFDFERTVDGIQALENTLNPLLHSVALLEREVEKEEAAMVKDYANLSTLEANARAEARAWRERGKREHPLAPAARKAGEKDTTDEQPLELVKSEGVGSGSVFQVSSNNYL